MEKILVTPREAAEMISMSWGWMRKHMYEEFTVVKIGRAARIPVLEIQHFIEKKCGKIAGPLVIPAVSGCSDEILVGDKSLKIIHREQ